MADRGVHPPVRCALDDNSSVPGISPSGGDDPGTTHAAYEDFQGGKARLGHGATRRLGGPDATAIQTDAKMERPWISH